jgi:hypothetical protein
MRKTVLFFSFIAGSMAVKAQTVATFESLSLSKADTSYINFSNPMKDVGFDDGLAHFPCIYDTAYGGYWVKGFSYSNWTDSVTSGFTNQYAAKTAQGFSGSKQYAVAYGTVNTLPLKGAAIGQSVQGFYITNSTFAYNSMRDGDGFSKKFTGANKDWFRLDVFAYRSGAVVTTDSVSFYLADFRNTDTTLNYIVRDWQWLNLLRLGHADSLQLRLSSSDVGSFGMNTPAYFCMDNFTTNETGMSVTDPATAGAVKVYPNPAASLLTVETGSLQLNSALIADYSGRIIARYPISGSKLELNTSALAPGMYVLTLADGTQQRSVRFVKQ